MFSLSPIGIPVFGTLIHECSGRTQQGCLMLALDNHQELMSLFDIALDNHQDLMSTDGGGSGPNTGLVSDHC